MSAIPVKANVLKTEHKNGKVYLTVAFARPGWQRLMGAERICERTFGLDAYGKEVYGLCNGKHSVQRCVEMFARNHHLSIPEAELAVTAFFKTLIKKGLIAIALKAEDLRTA